MGKVQKFEISFDQSQSVYGPGESISGKVTVKLERPLQCKGESPFLFSTHLFAETGGQQGSSSVTVTSAEPCLKHPDPLLLD